MLSRTGKLETVCFSKTFASEPSTGVTH